MIRFEWSRVKRRDGCANDSHARTHVGGEGDVGGREDDGEEHGLLAGENDLFVLGRGVGGRGYEDGV